MQVLRVHGPHLSDRQSRLLQMCCNGYSNIEIAEYLALDANSVDMELSEVMGKVTDLFRSLGPIKGNLSDLRMEKDESAQPDRWEPQIQLILLDHGAVKVTLDRPPDQRASASQSSG